MWQAGLGIAVGKAAHFLLAPDEVGEEKAKAWLEEYSASIGAADFFVDTFAPVMRTGHLLARFARTIYNSW